MKEGMKRVTKGPLKRILIFTLILTLLLSGSVFARYTGSFNASDDARVARMGVKVEVINVTASGGATTSRNGDALSVSFTDVNQSFSLGVVVTNNSEVAVQGVIKPSRSDGLPVYFDKVFLTNEKGETVSASGATFKLLPKQTQIMSLTIQSVPTTVSVLAATYALTVSVKNVPS